jgi:SEC-C motif
MKTGRNDPCPCGSGKKYKKCCLGKDSEAAAHKPLPTTPPRDWLSAPPAEPPVFAPPRPLPEPPPRPRDPAAERAHARWKEFESQDRTGRIAVFLKTLDDPELMEDEMAFEMLNRLHAEAVTAGERPRFAGWVATLRERRPELFEASAHYYLSWCLADALAEGRTEAVRPLALELAAHAGSEPDAVSRSLEALAYHGQLAVLVEAMRIGWPDVKASSEIFPWAIHEFAETAAVYEIFDTLEHTPALDPADAALQERLKFFMAEPDQDFIRRFIADLTGQDGRAWTMEDFALQPPRQKRRRDWDDDDEEEETDQPDEGARNLDRLIVEFIGYLRRQEGVPYPKGQLARGELFEYFLRRHGNELDPQPSMLEGALHPNRRLPKPPKPIHPLCPERVTLDVHLTGMVQFLNVRYHRAAAFFDVVPAWLRFLESRGLIDADIRTKVVADLRPLHTQVLKLWEGYRDDPTLLRAAQQWPADAAKGGPGSPG